MARRSAKRSGEWTLEQVLAHAKKLNAEIEAAIANSPLPENVNREEISKLVAEVHLKFWK